MFARGQRLKTFGFVVLGLVIALAIRFSQGEGGMRPDLALPTPASNGSIDSLGGRFPLPEYDSQVKGQSRPLDLPTWFEEAKRLPVEQNFVFLPTDREDIRSIRAIGFEQTAPDTFRKKVDLFGTESLVYSHSSDLPNVDAVAVISVYRSDVAEQYLYRTLRSLLSELPKDVVVNVLVGNADLDYVSAVTLGQELGVEQVDRIHVISSPKDVAQHFADNHYSTPAKATWNYARALRSYRGESSILLFEDDIELAQHAVQNMRPWLHCLPSQVVLLFNDGCKDKPFLWQLPNSSLGIGQRPVHGNTDYFTLQAILYSKAVAVKAGDYIANRADRETHDFMLARFFSGTTGGLSFFYPSVVQHIGIKTTGLSAEGKAPISKCFERSLAVVNERIPGGM